MITTLFHAATSSVTHCHAASTTMQSPAAQRVRGGRGEGEGEEGGDERHSQPPAIHHVTHIQSPAPSRAAACESEEGGGRGGDDNDLLSRGQHDHIQSPAPQRAYKRLCWRLFHSLLEVVPRGGEGRLGVCRHLPLVGFAHKGRAVGGVGERVGVYRHLTQGSGGSFMRNHGAAAVGTLRGTRRDYPSIGCLECITTTSTGMGGKGREAARCGRDTTFETTNTSSSGPATH